MDKDRAYSFPLFSHSDKGLSFFRARWLSAAGKRDILFDIGGFLAGKWEAPGKED